MLLIPHRFPKKITKMIPIAHVVARLRHDEKKQRERDARGLPLPPTSFRWKFNMSRLIRQIGVLNRGYPLQPFLNNKRCEFAIDVSRKPVRVEDYLFVVDVELGEPIIPECVDPVSALVIVSVVFMTIFFLLTKDLDDY